MNKKHIIKIVLILVLIIGTLGLMTSFRQEGGVTANTTTSEEALTIDSLGNIYQYDETKNPLGNKVVIPASVKGTKVVAISDNAFKNKNITQVSLAEGIEKIGSSAFTSNPITSVDFPSSIKEIKDFAFYSTQIKELTFSSNIIFGSSSFSKISTLTKVTFIEGVQTISGGSIFIDCAIEELSLPSSLESISGISVFSKNKISTLQLPQNLKTLGVGAFDQNQITEITIPSSLIELPQNAFSNNPLKKITLSEGLTKIGRNCFEKAKITEIVIPNSVTDIGVYAFMNCSSLKKVKLGNQITLIDTGAFINSSIEEVELPNSLKTINMYAFAGADMMYIDIPESVTTINNGFFQQIRTCYIKKQGQQYIFEFPQQMDMTKTTITSSDQAYTQSDYKVIFGSLPQNLKYNYTVANSKLTSTEMDVTVKFIEQKYKVTFLDENGTTLDEVQVSAGDTASTNITPTKENHTFIGWDKPLENITGDLVVKALYKGLPIVTSEDIEMKINQAFNPLNYIQAKDADGQQITNINIIKNNVNMAKEGQYEVEYEVIDQWNGKVTGKFKVKVISVHPKQYQIQYKNYNGEVIENLIVAEGKMPTPSRIPQRNGYTFVGWDKEIIIAQMDTTYTAVFKRLPIIIVQDVIIQLNQLFNPLDHIQAVDADGHKITNIQIIKNNVNIKEVGQYEIVFEVIDQWNGKAKEKFNVYVEGDGWKYRVIEEKKSEVEVKALLHNQAYLVVEVIKVDTNQLYQYVDKSQGVIGSYEVRIVGKYKGKINVVFPIDKQYEGYTVYIQHLKKDGTIDNFTRISKNQQVSVEVDELSPFIITIDKNDLITNDKEVKTNDNGNSKVYLVTALISLTIGLFIFKKKKDC